MSRARDEQHWWGDERLNENLGPGRGVSPAYVHDGGSGCGEGRAGCLRHLPCSIGISAKQGERTKSLAVLIIERLLARCSSPLTACRDNRCQRHRLLLLQGCQDRIDQLEHGRLVEPG